MAQFDVFQNPRGGAYPLLLDVQSEVLARLGTRVVVPMTARKKHGPTPITRLNPVLPVDGVDYVLVVQELAAIPSTALGKRVGSLASARRDIVAALDLLITGI